MNETKENNRQCFSKIFKRKDRNYGKRRAISLTEVHGQAKKACMEFKLVNTSECNFVSQEEGNMTLFDFKKLGKSEKS